MADHAGTPRRRIELKLEAGADSWDDLRFVLRSLETDIARHGKLSRALVSGGYSCGWILSTHEDERITHEIWADASEAYCRALVDGEQSSQSPNDHSEPKP